MTGPVRLSPIQQRAVAALVTTKTATEAAAMVGVSDRTLRRYLAQPEFAAEYRHAARDSSQRAVSAVLAAQERAVETLCEVMATGTPAARVRAARALLEVGLRVGTGDLDERLRLLEEEVQRWDDAEPPALRLV